MEFPPPPRRLKKRSRFASQASTSPKPSKNPSQVPPTSSNDNNAINDNNDIAKPLSLPTFTRGKYKFAAARRNIIINRQNNNTLASESKSVGSPDRASSLFSSDDYDDDSTINAFEKPKPQVLPPLNSLSNQQSSPLNPAVDTNSNGISKNQNLNKNHVNYDDDPLESFMQTLTESVPQTKRPRTISSNVLDVERADSPSVSDEEDDHEMPTSTNSTTRAKRVYEKVDHSKVDYPSFEKNLYIPVPELRSMTHAQILARRRELDNMRVRGRNCPNPIFAWAQCGLSSALLSILRRHDYTTPTSIQAQAIPCIMSGRDVIGIARTGSGKTLAFLLPLLRHISRRPRAVPGDGPAALVIAPTRELAIQIYGETKRFAKAISIHSVCAYGGSGLKDQIAELKRGADVIICTPGRMIDLLAMNSGRVCNLRRVTFVVLDEADRMFDMGFEPQLTRIVENIRPDRQTVMFSATFPIQVEKIARKILHQPIEIMVGGNSVAASTIDQHVEVRSEDSKFFRLLELLGQWYEKGSTLVFVDRQDNADRIFRDLCKARYKCLSLHGGMDQADRDSTIVDFKNGVIKVLIATSVAARGLDVKHLTLVVNYDVPSHYEDYIHRVGRTGRAGRSGTAYTFITPDQESFAPDLVKALERSARATAIQEAGGASSLTVARAHVSKDEDKEAIKKLADEAAEMAVPEELRQLANSFEAKRKAGVIKYASKSGYGGRGFKFEENDDEYNATKTALRKMQAKQYGMDDDVVEDDEDEDGDGDDAGGDDNNNINRAVKKDRNKKVDGEDESDDDIVEIRPKSTSTTSQKGSKKSGVGSGDDNHSQQRSGNFVNNRIPLHHPNKQLSNDEIQQLLAEATRKAEQEADSENANEIRRRALIATARAQILSLATLQKGGGYVGNGKNNFNTLNNPNKNNNGTKSVSFALSEERVNIPKPEASHIEEEQSGVRFAGELEINDYPANARWGVVRKGALADVEEFTGCVVTTRGNYYPPGRNPPAGERKLHFLIEGPSRGAVKMARRDIRQKLEETSAMSRPGETQYSKYSVV